MVKQIGMYTVAFIIVVALSVTYGVALAHQQAVQGVAFFACENANTGVVNPETITQDDNLDCPSSKKVSWNVEGLPGRDNVSNYTMLHSDWHDARPGDIVDIKCPAGTKVLGGGADLSSTKSQVLSSSRPTSGGDGWQASYAGRHHFIRLWVICAEVTTP